MLYLVDTNVWSVFLRGRDRNVEAMIRAKRRQDLVLCSIVRGELLHGWVRNQRSPRLGQGIQTLLRTYPSLPYTDRAAEHYAVIRYTLEKKGGTIGPNDMLIAAIALAHDLILVTHNTREFHRVIGLRVEDWEIKDKP